MSAKLAPSKVNYEPILAISGSSVVDFDGPKYKQLISLVSKICHGLRDVVKGS
jgi:hypothetical protein